MRVAIAVFISVVVTAFVANLIPYHGHHPRDDALLFLIAAALVAVTTFWLALRALRRIGTHSRDPR